MIERKKSKPSKTNLIVSVVFHTLLIVAIVFFAAREGMLGKKLKEITVTMVPKEKPQPPKEKPPEPKVEQPKVAEAPKPLVPPPQSVAPPPPSDSAPAVAPAPAIASAFDFGDGAHAVESVSDPKSIFKALVEHSFRSRWNRPENVADEKYIVDVEVTVEKDGTVDGYRWVKGSGDERWDKSVRDALAQTKAIDRPPPKGFPTTFIVRFDVQSDAADDTIQLGSL